MARVNSYLGLITSQHRNRPKFAEVVRELTNAIASGADLLDTMVGAFDLDEAAGRQLDIIGEWVGMSRVVQVPLAGVYFEWGAPAKQGWSNGFWKGPFDPATGPVQMDDSTFRVLIRGKIAANMWDGTLASMYGVWDYVFGPGAIEVIDNQDMTITVVYDTLALSSVMQQLLITGAFPLKPAGVEVNFIAAGGAPIFAWGFNTNKFQGWTGEAVWAAPS